MANKTKMSDVVKWPDGPATPILEIVRESTWNDLGDYFDGAYVFRHPRQSILR